jgi:parvulin-like peptidyl-prolyl isomerase
MNINPVRIISLSVAACVIIILFCGGGLSFGFTLDKVLAVVDKEVITLSDYLVFAKSMGAAVTADVNEALLKKLIEEKVILHEAYARGVEVSDTETDTMLEEVKKDGGLSQSDLERELMKEGTNFSSYRKVVKERLIALKLIGAEVDSKVIVTEKEIEKFYSENRKDYMARPARAEVEAIFLRLNEDATVTEITDLKRKALRIADELRNGGNFDSLADRYNDEQLRERQGRLGEFQRGALIPQLDVKVFSMGRGDVSGPIWVKEGVYIVKLVKRTDDEFRPLEDVRGEIYGHLFAQKREKIFNGWVRSLWEKALITINRDQAAEGS